jgi:hypothetical protein
MIISSCWKKRLGLLMVLLGAPGIASVSFMGCGADTMVDSLNHRKDVERQNSGINRIDYAKLAGTYDPDVTVSGEPYRISAEMRVTEIVRDDSQVPQPSITGHFTVADSGTGRSRIFSFSNGKYDDLSASFSAIVPCNGKKDIDIHCDVAHGGTRLSCDWATNGAAPGFHFTMVRK